jgi:hypothetical protein
MHLRCNGRAAGEERSAGRGKRWGGERERAARRRQRRRVRTHRFVFASGGSLRAEDLQLGGSASSSPSLRRTARLRRKGGPRAGESGGGSTGSPMWRKKRSMLACAMTRARSLHPRAAAIALFAVCVEGSLEKPGPLTLHRNLPAMTARAVVWMAGTGGADGGDGFASPRLRRAPRDAWFSAPAVPMTGNQDPGRPPLMLHARMNRG